MAEQENLDIYLRAKNETDAAFAAVNSNVDKTEQNVKSAKSNIEDFNDRARPMVSSFTEIASAISLVGGTFQVVSGIYDELINKTVEGAMKVEDLSDLIGASAEESSKLIQAAQLIGIDYATLTSGLEVAISKGYKPTIEGLGEIADAFIAIEDPIERSNFLIETFGRKAGPEMEELLSGGSRGLEEYYKKVEAVGTVLDEKAVKAAKDFAREMGEVQMRTDALKMSIGGDFLPLWADVVDFIMDGVDALDALGASLLDMYPPLNNLIYSIRSGLEAYRTLKGEITNSPVSQTQTGTVPTLVQFDPTAGRAGGGPMWAGVGRWVGEQRPEWFEPNTGGTISDGPPSGGGAAIEKVEINIYGGDPREVRRVCEQVINDRQATGRLR